MSKRRRPRALKRERTIPSWLRERTILAAVLVVLVVTLTTAAALANRWGTWGRVDDHAEGKLLRGSRCRSRSWKSAF